VNFWGVVHGIRTFVPILIESGEEGHVVNTASMAALTCAPLSGPYSVSKHAVLALSETLYHELAGHRPRLGVSALCPEGIATRIDSSERNRPGPPSDPAPSAHPAIEALHGVVARGLAPERMAERVLAGIESQQFYLLPDDGDDWRDACDARLDEIRGARNPIFRIPGSVVDAAG